jgi:hypothetical protein
MEDASTPSRRASDPAWRAFHVRDWAGRHHGHVCEGKGGSIQDRVVGLVPVDRDVSLIQMICTSKFDPSISCLADEATGCRVDTLSALLLQGSSFLLSRPKMPPKWFELSKRARWSRTRVTDAPFSINWHMNWRGDKAAVSSNYCNGL